MEAVTAQAPALHQLQYRELNRAAILGEAHSRFRWARPSLCGELNRAAILGEAPSSRHRRATTYIWAEQRESFEL